VTDDKLESMIGAILRSGVAAAALVAGVAGIVYLIQFHSTVIQYGKFELEGNDLRTVTGIVRSSLQFRSEAIIQLGLLLLIATPIARVALAGIGFWLERDYLYVIVSTLVLMILLFSLIHSA
jgi:uncharacterized membrane protein